MPGLWDELMSRLSGDPGMPPPPLAASDGLLGQQPGIPETVLRYMQTGPSMSDSGKGQVTLPDGTWQQSGVDQTLEPTVDEAHSRYAPLWRQLWNAENSRAWNYPREEGGVVPAVPPSGMVRLPDGRWVDDGRWVANGRWLAPHQR